MKANLIYEIENVLEAGDDILDGVALAEEAGYTVIAHHDDGCTGWENCRPVNYESEEEYTLANQEGNKIVISCTTAGCGSCANRYYGVVERRKQL